ncbi:MAG: hypothetical protein IPP78_09930 [Holophagaceae bacterium]|nr:hypothetical protein [Holophagaceae bacterium]
MDTKINFYGKVLDEQGLPVEGAEVMLHLKRYLTSAPPWFEQIIDISLKSDKQGQFSITNEKGRDLFVKEVKRKGYETSLNHHTRTSYNYSTEMDAVFVPDPQTPVVFWMRKKGDEAFVLTTGLTSSHQPDFRFNQEESGLQKGIDIVQGLEIKEKDLTKPAFNDDPLYCDLKAKAIFDPKTKTWTMVLTPGGADDGILFSEQFLYEAPADGYLLSYTIHPDAFRKEFGLTESSERVEKGQIIQNPGIYLYLRSRGLYSRTHITHLVANKEAIWLSGGSTVLNPYGDRILEKAADLPGDVSVGLRIGVRETFRRNPTARPPKPDLPKLVREWEKNRSATEKLKDWLKR